ncbi:MAG TPA: DUF3810 family protein, partial [Anseongella sp.]|nr:DUF3810 family protein [Anseongella sp.]
MNKNIRRKILAVLILLPLILLISWLNTHPGWVERLYALPVYPLVGDLLRLLFSWIPFSIGDILYLIAAGLLVWQLLKLFRNLFSR